MQPIDGVAVEAPDAAQDEAVPIKSAVSEGHDFFHAFFMLELLVNRRNSQIPLMTIAFDDCLMKFLTFPHPFKYSDPRASHPADAFRPDEGLFTIDLRCCTYCDCKIRKPIYSCTFCPEMFLKT